MLVGAKAVKSIPIPSLSLMFGGVVGGGTRKPVGILSKHYNYITYNSVHFSRITFSLDSCIFGVWEENVEVQTSKWSDLESLYGATHIQATTLGFHAQYSHTSLWPIYSLNDNVRKNIQDFGTDFGNVNAKNNLSLNKFVLFWRQLLGTVLFYFDCVYNW